MNFGMKTQHLANQTQIASKSYSGRVCEFLIDKGADKEALTYGRDSRCVTNLC